MDKIVGKLSSMFNLSQVKKGDKVKEKMIAALVAAGIKTDGLSDDDIFAKYSELLSRKVEPEVKPDMENKNNESIVKAIENAMRPLQEQMASMKEELAKRDNAEQKSLSDAVVALDIGIDEEAAKTMTVNSLKAILSKNGVLNVNAIGGNKSGDTSLADMKMP